MKRCRTAAAINLDTQMSEGIQFDFSCTLKGSANEFDIRKFSEGGDAVKDWAIAVRAARRSLKRGKDNPWDGETVNLALKGFLSARAEGAWDLVESSAKEAIFGLMKKDLPNYTKGPKTSDDYHWRKNRFLNLVSNTTGGVKSPVSISDEIVQEAFQRKDGAFFRKLAEQLEAPPTVASNRWLLASLWTVPNPNLGTIYPLCFWTDPALEEFFSAIGSFEIFSHERSPRSKQIIRYHRRELGLQRPPFLFVKSFLPVRGDAESLDIVGYRAKHFERGMRYGR